MWASDSHIVRFPCAGKKEFATSVGQEKIADMCGLDRTDIGGVERGERNVALVNIEKIARALRISLAELSRV